MYWLEPKSMNRFSGVNRLLRELDQVFGIQEERPSQLSSFPKLNVYKNSEAALVTAEVPGLDPKDIELNIHADKLVISGEFPRRNRAEGDAYERIERSSGKFHRELTLPFRSNPETVNASYKNGVLKIMLARAEEDKPKKIIVKTA